MQVNMKFNNKALAIPPKNTQEGKTLRVRLDRDSIGINNSPQKETNNMSVIEKILVYALSVN